MQMIEDGRLSTVGAFASGPIPKCCVTQEVAEEFSDAVNGGYRDEKMVRTARAVELECVEKADLFISVPRSEATSKPSTLKWVRHQYACEAELQKSIGAA